jgi:ribosomal protein S18 acetylase RimI-like enzyme
MNIKIRSATVNDASFIAWVMLAAVRSHNKYGAWEHYVGGTEEDCLTFLRLLATTQGPHLFHYSTFIVAEINGQKVGALSGYDPKTQGMRAFVKAMPEVMEKLGWSKDFQKDAMERNLPFMACFPDNVDGAWVVENVAVLPEHRRQGIVDLMLKEILDRGRKNGFKLAQIGVIIDNKPARGAYEKHGFKFDSEKRNADFEKIYGSPGIARLFLAL